MKEIRWHGRGGQGSFTVARLLGKAAVLFEGKYALAFPSFGPERRGAPVLGFTKIDDKRITDRSEVQECDYVVVLDESLIDNNITKGLKSNGVIIINSAHPEKYNNLKNVNTAFIDATSLALEILGRPITNTTMLGALIAVSGIIDLESGEKAIADELKSSLVEKNVKILREAYNIVKKGINHE
ncbi:MAG: 2-oxoacid:acceptor oxidoreductase family protein [Bacteroidales bacterium]|jgi:pyruvate ferredoxin oxidoreductase gamma subunit|nr:2-oxoacid:acceptor oxidoreductase family protein [Bacteroidales bacterium]